MPIFRKVFQYKISTELPWSIRIFMMTKLATSMVTTIGSSCFRFMFLKSEFVKSMGGRSLLLLLLMEYTELTARRCLFREDDVVPPPTKPPAIVFMTPRTGMVLRRSLPPLPSRPSRPLWPLRSFTCVSLRPCLFSMSTSFFPSSRLVWTKRRRWLAWMSSSILSFSAQQSSVVCPKLRWYRQCLVWSALYGVGVLLGAFRRSALRASSKTLDLSAVKGV